MQQQFLTLHGNKEKTVQEQQDSTHTYSETLFLEFQPDLKFDVKNKYSIFERIINLLLITSIVICISKICVTEALGVIPNYNIFLLQKYHIPIK